MKKFLCLMIMTILLFTMTSCGSYVVEGEDNALAVYTCSSDNMCGLEKVVIFENKVVTVFNKRINDKSEYGDCSYGVEGKWPYSVSIKLSNLSGYPSKESSIEVKNGKYIATTIFEYDDAKKIDPDKDVMVEKIFVGNQSIVYSDEGINLHFTIEGGECSNEFDQNYDFSTNKWSEVDTELILFPMTPN